MAGLVGYGELVSRYQDSPARLLTTSATVFYVTVNVAAAMLAFGLIRALHVLESTDPTKATSPTWLYQLLLASFGAIAFFRTSLFTVHVGGTDIGIGPSAMLQALLNAADRMIDRDQAKTRAGRAAEILKDIDYRRARAPLPAFCIVLMQNPTPADSEAVLKQIATLDARTDIDDDSKMRMLGVYLIRLVGDEVLRRSVDSLRDLISKSAVPLDGIDALVSGLDFGKARSLLLEASLAALPSATATDKDATRRLVNAIAARSDINDDFRMILLGSYLRNLLGIDSLKSVINDLGNQITKPPPPPKGGGQS